MKKFFLLVLVFAFTQTYAQSWADTVAKIEKLYAKYKAENPGVQLAISRNGQILFSKAWGMADLEHGAVLTTDSKIEAGSVSKQFTAAAILLLEKQGKLNLMDDIRKYFPEMKDYGATITIAHLIHHTSGLKDWGSIAEMEGWPRTTKTYSNEDAKYLIFKQTSLNNVPGDEYIYSNSNYIMLTLLVQQVSGLSLADFTRQYIFEPAGMKHTSWRDNRNRIVPNRAIAYRKAGKDYYTQLPNEDVYGPGGLLTTAKDLLAWNHFYLSNQLGILNNQLQTTKLNNGKQHLYTAGLMLETYQGLNIVTHNGATASYRADLWHAKELGLSIAWLSNTSEFDANGGSGIGNDLKKIFVAQKTVTQAPKENFITITENEALPLTGWYKNNRGGYIQIGWKDNVLLSQNLGKLDIISLNELRAVNNHLLFADKNNLQLITPVKDTVAFKRVAAADTSLNNMQSYTGIYESEDVAGKLTVTYERGVLKASRLPDVELNLHPLYKDGFDFEGNGILYFERNKKNKPISFFITISRARNIKFTRVEK